MACIVSYNCNFLRNNFEIVKSLTLNFDIVCLQEIRLFQEDLSLINDINPDFDFIADTESKLATNDFNNTIPYKGVAILWNKKLSQFIESVKINDRIIGIKIKTANEIILLINVYLPVDRKTIDSKIDYINELSILQNLIDDTICNHVILVGDFNADPNKNGNWQELARFAQNNLILPLHDNININDFTFLSPANDSTSLIDHVFCSKLFKNYISNISILYDVSIYDHFPICFKMNIKLDFIEMNRLFDFTKNCSYVKWHTMKESDFRDYTREKCRLD